MRILGVTASGIVGFDPAYELISTSILSSSQSSVVFDVSSLDSTYKHLQLRVVGRTSRVNESDGFGVRLNNDSGNNYSNHGLSGNGSVVSSFFQSDQTTQIFVDRLAGSSAAANIFGSAIVDILDPFSSTKNKTLRSLGGGTTGSAPFIMLKSGAYYSTTSISSVQVRVNDFFVSGTRISLYGIRG
jgi:hypothetical protein